MNPKERYRLRQNLQAALLRVVDVVGKMHLAGVDFNPDNAVTVEMVLHLLVEVRNSGRCSARDSDQDEVVKLAVEELDKAKKRRQMQTIRRRKAAARQKKGPLP